MGSWRGRAIAGGVGLLGFLAGVGVGACGETQTSTIAPAAGHAVTVTTLGRTVTHVVVHVHTTTVTHTQTVTAPERQTTTTTTEREGVGSSSHAEDSQFCSEHTCIGNFQGEGGTVVECADGSYSHAGGISGACSHHGGES
jgi:hypothetical protein